MPKFVDGRDEDDEGRSLGGSIIGGDKIDQEVDKHREPQRRSRKQLEDDADREFLGSAFFGNCEDEED